MNPRPYLEPDATAENTDATNMGLIATIFGGVSREEMDGIRLDRRRPFWEISGTTDFPALLTALVDLLPAGCVLYFEGGSPGGPLREFLRQHRIPEQAHVACSTRWPRPRVFHLRATPEIMASLAGLMRSWPYPELAIHFHVYCGKSVLLEWRDAFNDPMVVSGELPGQSVRIFAKRLQMALKQRPAEPGLRAVPFDKHKPAVVAFLAILFFAGVVFWRGRGDGLTPLAIITQTQSAYAALTSYGDTTKGTIGDNFSSSWTTCAIRLQRPKLYRVEWSSAGRPWVSQGLIWSDGSANFEVINATPEKFAVAKAETARDMPSAFIIASAWSGGVAATVPGEFFAMNSVDKLRTFVSGRSVLKRRADETIGGVDCYVVASAWDAGKMDQAKLPSAGGKLGTTTITLWIGKRDHLIRKVFTSVASPAQARAFSLAETHENIVVNRRYAVTDFQR